MEGDQKATIRKRLLGEDRDEGSRQRDRLAARVECRLKRDLFDSGCRLRGRRWQDKRSGKGDEQGKLLHAQLLVRCRTTAYRTVWAAVATVVSAVKDGRWVGGAWSCVQTWPMAPTVPPTRRNQASSPMMDVPEVGPCSGRSAGGLRARAMSTPLRAGQARHTLRP